MCPTVFSHFLLTLLAPAIGQVASAQKRRSNLLFILTDQQRFDTIRRVQDELRYPGVRIDTPNLDRLSWESAYFRNAYTHCAVCGPARTSLLTGHTIENTGVRTNRMAYDEYRNLPGNDAVHKIPLLRTYDEILVQDHGYVAEYYGKWHSPECKGFVYSNDLRMSGAVNGTWFGKYESDNNRTKHYALGQRLHYREWLDDHNYTAWQPQGTQQRDIISHRPYVPDPLDARYRDPYDDSKGSSDQGKIHGRSLLPDGMSLTAQQGSEVIEALRRLQKAGRPFSLHVSFNSPHPPTIATDKFYSMYNPREVAPPVSLFDNMGNSAYRSRQQKRKSGYRNVTNVQRWKATYYGLITEVDDWVGQIIDELEDLRISNDTMIVFTSDHGEMLGSHGMKDKFVFYEESARVPLLLRFPGAIHPGTVVDASVSHLDLHSTILDYLGVHGDYKTDGTSLRRYIEGKDEDDRFVVTFYNFTDESEDNIPRDDPAFMIRKGPWKLIVPGSASSAKVDMLFNLCADPYETNNLVGKNAKFATDETIGKAEHMKTLLMHYLITNRHPAAGEIKSRRKWPSLPFWVGDTALSFRKVLPDGTRTELLYMGTSGNKTVSVTNIYVVGDIAGHFSLNWNVRDELRVRELFVLNVTYSNLGVSPSETGSCPCMLVIENSAGNDRYVNLLPPHPYLDPDDCLQSTFMNT